MKPDGMASGFVGHEVQDKQIASLKRSLRRAKEREAVIRDWLEDT